PRCSYATRMLLVCYSLMRTASLVQMSEPGPHTPKSTGTSTGDSAHAAWHLAGQSRILPSKMTRERLSQATGLHSMVCAYSCAHAAQQYLAYSLGVSACAYAERKVSGLSWLDRGRAVSSLPDLSCAW